MFAKGQVADSVALKMGMKTEVASVVAAMADVATAVKVVVTKTAGVDAATREVSLVELEMEEAIGERSWGWRRR